MGGGTVERKDAPADVGVEASGTSCRTPFPILDLGESTALDGAREITVGRRIARSVAAERRVELVQVIDWGYGQRQQAEREQ
jgi:hypothetical protein